MKAAFYTVTLCACKSTPTILNSCFLFFSIRSFPFKSAGHHSLSWLHNLLKVLVAALFVMNSDDRILDLLPWPDTEQKVTLSHSSGANTFLWKIPCLCHFSWVRRKNLWFFGFLGQKKFKYAEREPQICQIISNHVQNSFSPWILPRLDLLSSDPLKYWRTFL